MSRLVGMSIKEFNDTIKEMKSIYDFNDEEAYLGNSIDPTTCAERYVEVHVKDEKTGINIIMDKYITIKE